MLKRPGSACLGLRSFAVADFNGDHSADLAVLQSNGTVRVCSNDRVDAPARMLRLPKGTVRPSTVSCWTDEKVPSLTGLALVTGHAPGAYRTRPVNAIFDVGGDAIKMGA